MPERPGTPASDHWRAFRILFAIVLGANAILLLIDHAPQFYDGDAMVYLGAAFGGAPGDRSFAYGRYFIAPLLRVFRSLDGVVIAQVILSACCAMMIAVILDRGLKISRWIAFGAALAYVIEPLALLYERMMMTEVTALFCFAGFLLLGVAYLCRPRAWLLVAMAADSVACVALRVSFLPVLVASMVLLPPLGLLRVWWPPRAVLARCALHLALGLVAMFWMHGQYKQLFHSITGQPSAYNSGDGFFLLASWSPLLTRADVPDPALFDRIRPTLGDLSNPLGRPGQLYTSGQLISDLVDSEHGDRQAANTLARTIAFNILRRDPLGVLALGWTTYMEFWDPNVLAHVIHMDEGPQPADQDMIDLFQSRYGENIAPNHEMPTLTKWWHGQGAPWYRFVLLSPLVWLVALMLRPRDWRALLLIGLAVVGLMLVDTLLVVEPVVRYLHSLAWLTVLLCGVILQGVIDLAARIAGRTGRAPRSA